MNKQIITRFPPSPTGYLHVGGARTALFNWLYARHTQGKFVLRIEDTDVARSTQASTDAILEALEWLGIDWDEGPYFQSQRSDIYSEYIEKLLSAGLAYYCTCSRDTLDAMRQKAMETGGKPKYDGTCRNKGLSKTDDAVVRFKAPLTGSTIIKDVVKGNIVIPNAEMDDFIIQRSDGVSTYNLAVVVDDITMAINTVIRGDDHVNNTPKQILLYQALNAPLPTFGHVPMVLGKDRARLSKRHGAMSVTAYRDMGYLPDAFLNYLVRLGWSYGDQEFFTKDELIDKFTLENIGRSPGIFDTDKLLALNAEHIRKSPPAVVARHLIPFLKQRDCEADANEFTQAVIQTLSVRSKTLAEMADGALFYYASKITYDAKAAKKFLKPAIAEPLNQLIKALEALDVFDEPSLENAFKTVMETAGMKLGKIAQPVRVALTGKTVSPGIFEMIVVLGQDTVIARLKDAAKFIENRQT
ncbi:glutamate--tRNA ligase [Desulfococcaceae bacterium HSG7]|nr:glutamate--tRNA ligase [Desulfococcaceae bacterium HSG7]